MSVAPDAHRARAMRFGLTTAFPRPGAEARVFARRVEAAGFDVLTFADHLAPVMPPFAGAAAAGVVKKRMHVGTLVLNNDFRHPVDTAREAAGIATVTDGRFELGIGQTFGDAGYRRSDQTPPQLMRRFSPRAAPSVRIWSACCAQTRPLARR